MKFTTALFFALFSFSTFSASEIVAQCAVNEVSAGKGVRVNLRQKEDGDFKANLIFGTTVSGTTYHLEETSAGVYEGSIKGKPKFSMKLVIGLKAKTNNYVTGYASSLEATYPSNRMDGGIKSVQTQIGDQFVCGKIIARF